MRIERQQINGYYIKGEVGRGKTQIMDIFFETLDVKKKKRVHFHRFMKILHDDLDPNLYPTPHDSSNIDDCIAGRIRVDYSQKNTVSLWVVGDQIRKGAALNAVQIAEALRDKIR